jgi:5,6-dimethylbenzimidazole synthase
MTLVADGAQPPGFDVAFQRSLGDLFRWRRDVRRFKLDPIPFAMIEAFVALASRAPSVGNSQPWRFVSVETPARRQAIIANFDTCNTDALHDYEGERAGRYARLKLAGLRDAPVHLAVFCDRGTLAGAGLGRKTMPETLDYSVVAAIHTFWLAARAHGVGVGWVSILDPAAVTGALDLCEDWKLIAYLCVGLPEENHLDAELERQSWQARIPENARLHRR